MGRTRRKGPTFIQRSRQKGSAEKAAYHEIAGAGRSRVKRPFFGLSEADMDVLTDRYTERVGTLINESR
jgi:hypothetical protein